MKFLSRMVLISSIIIGIQTPLFSEGIRLEQVIVDVSTKSDSAKMMQETINRSKQLIREKWSAAFPVVSTQIYGGGKYGLAPAKIDSRKMETLSDNIPGLLGEMMKYEPAGSSEYSAMVQVTQPFYTFGKVGTAVKVANMFDSSVFISCKGNKQKLQLLGLDAYYKVLLSEKAMLITERSIERRKELSEFLKRNFEMGSGTKAQILSSDADLQSLWPEIIKAHQEVKSAKMQLCMLMGKNVTDSITIDTTSGMQKLLEMQLPQRDEALKAALSKRSDLQSLDYMKRANEGGAKIFRAMYLPTIAGQATLGIAADSLKKLVDKDYINGKLGVVLSWTMFDGFANRSIALQYESDKRKLQTASSAMKKMIEIEVDNDLTECIVADSNLTVSQNLYAAAKEGYDLTNENFKQGSGQFAELQLSEERLRQAELNIMNAKYRQIRSRAALLVTMGLPIISMEEK